MRGVRVWFTIAALAVLAGACSGGDDDTAAPTDSGSEPTASSTTSTTASPGTTTTEPPSTTTTAAPTTTTTLPPDEDAGLDLPRRGVYGHVLITLTSAEYSNDTPGTRLEDEPEPGVERYLYVGYDMEFEDGYPGTSEEFEVADFSLVLSDGTEVVSAQVDFRRGILVQDDRPQSAAFAFEGDAFDLAGAAVVYDNDVNEPITIPLDGPQPEDPYPVTLAVDEAGDVSYQGGCGDTTGSVAVLEAEWDLDAGVDEDGQAIVSAGTKRTLEGERFVRLRIQAVAGGGTCGGTVFNSDEFRLLVDGLPVGSENSFATQLDDGEGVEVVFGYRVPVDVDDLVLEVGTIDGTVARIAIPVPDPLS